MNRKSLFNRIIHAVMPNEPATVQSAAVVVAIILVVIVIIVMLAMPFDGQTLSGGIK